LEFSRIYLGHRGVISQPGALQPWNESVFRV